MTHSPQVSGPGRPMNERRDAVKEEEGLAEVLDGGAALPQANDTPEQQAADRDATGTDASDAGSRTTGSPAR